MEPTKATDIDGCRLILELIGHIDRRLGSKTLDQFENDKDEVDLTAFRLAIIGETTHRFTSGLRAKHPEINWRAIYALRNYAVHAYSLLNHEKVWNAAVYSLPALKALCETELARQLD